MRAWLVAAVRELYPLGLKDAAVARRLGVCRRHVTAVRKAAGLASHAAARRASRRRQFALLYAKGLCDPDIAAAVPGATGQQVWWWRRATGRPPNLSPAEARRQAARVGGLVMRDRPVTRDARGRFLTWGPA
jgi:hypothetical protein